MKQTTEPRLVQRSNVLPSLQVPINNVGKQYDWVLNTEVLHWRFKSFVGFLSVDMMGNKRNQLSRKIHLTAMKPLTSIKLSLLCGWGMYLHKRIPKLVNHVVVQPCCRFLPPQLSVSHFWAQRKSNKQSQGYIQISQFLQIGTGCQWDRLLHWRRYWKYRDMEEQIWRCCQQSECTCKEEKIADRRLCRCHTPYKFS